MPQDTFEGIILRAQLLVMLQERDFGAMQGPDMVLADVLQHKDFVKHYPRMLPLDKVRTRRRLPSHAQRGQWPTHSALAVCGQAGSRDGAAARVSFAGAARCRSSSARRTWSSLLTCRRT